MNQALRMKFKKISGVDLGARELIANARGLEATLIGVFETSGTLTYGGLFTSTFNGIFSRGPFLA
jgi:hypothetical protein